MVVMAAVIVVIVAVLIILVFVGIFRLHGYRYTLPYGGVCPCCVDLLASTVSEHCSLCFHVHLNHGCDTGFCSYSST
jgi:hypothetical protein